MELMGHVSCVHLSVGIGGVAAGNTAAVDVHVCSSVSLRVGCVYVCFLCLCARTQGAGVLTVRTDSGAGSLGGRGSS